MSRIIVAKSGKPTRRNTPFHPYLRIESTGYSPNGQYVGQCFRRGVFVGFSKVGEVTFTEAIQNYLSELERMDHRVVDVRDVY